MGRKHTHTHTRGTGALRSWYLGPVLTMFGKSKSEKKKEKKTFDFLKNTESHVNGKYSNGLSGAVYAASMENLLWRWKNLGKLQGNTSHYYYYCCTDDLTVMDSSQRVWTSTFYIVYLPCFRRAGGQYPTSLLMLVVVTVVLLLFKNKSEGA